MGLTETRLVGLDWIDLAQNKEVASACKWRNEPSGSIKCGVFLDYLKVC
jgi:hypothetical protein